MGIVNITPDSFSDGGDFYQAENAKLKIDEFIKNGVDIIDVGGESTGPNSKKVTLEEEMVRLKPVIDHVYNNKLHEKVKFSIDTYKAPIAEYALKNGFEIVNDVTSLRGDVNMIEILLKYKPYIVLMYSKDSTPRTTMDKIEYDDVIATIKTFLLERIATLIEAGFPEEQIIIDPGMGMFVSADPKYSFEIIDRLKELKQLGYPMLIGVSRKSFMGGKVEERDKPSAELSLRAIKNGASIIRTHTIQFLNKI